MDRSTSSTGGALVGVCSLAVSASVAIVFGAVGFWSYAGAEPGAGPILNIQGGPARVFLTICALNGSTALLLISGYVTAGVSTMLGSVLAWSWVGATLSAMVVDTGWSSLNPAAAWYIPLEFSALVIAGAAGFMRPVAMVVGGGSWLAGTFLRWAAGALVVLVLAAAVETWVIVSAPIE